MTTLILNCKVSWLARLTSHMTLSDTTNYYYSRPYRSRKNIKVRKLFEDPSYIHDKANSCFLQFCECMNVFWGRAVYTSCEKVLDSFLCNVGATQAETCVAREVLFLQTFMWTDSLVDWRVVQGWTYVGRGSIISHKKYEGGRKFFYAATLPVAEFSGSSRWEVWFRSINGMILTVQSWSTLRKTCYIATLSINPT